MACDGGKHLDFDARWFLAFDNWRKYLALGGLGSNSDHRELLLRGLSQHLLLLSLSLAQAVRCRCKTLFPSLSESELLLVQNFSRELNIFCSPFSCVAPNISSF